jgi:uncharacterized protein DUF5317
MILALIVAVVCAAIALARGGSLESLAATPLRWVGFLFGALVVQIGIDLLDPSWLNESGDVIVILLTNLAVIIFLIVNRGLPGVPLAALGLLLNLAVITLNGGMPVSARAAETAGLAEELRDPGVKHELLDDDTALPWLADVIPIPGLQKIISVGDVVLAIGIGRLFYVRTLEGKPSATPVPTSD